jgi:hypothetical protein
MKNDGVWLGFLSRHDDRVFQIVNIVIFSVLVIDIALYSASGIAQLTPTVTYETVLVILISIVIVGQLLILELIKRKNSQIIAKTPYLKSLGKIVRIAQYVLSAILVLIALQVALFSSYQTSILMVGVTLSYAVAMLIMGALSLLLFKWYIRNKTFSILIYGVASISALFTFLLTAVLVDYLLPGVPVERNPESQVNLFVFQDPIGGSMLYLGAISNLVAFLLYWVSTVVLLRHYAVKMGKIRFWSIMSGPVILFIFRYTVLAPMIASLAESPDANLVYLTVLSDVLTPAIGGLIYGFPFLSVSRSLKSGNVMLKRYLVIAFWGFVFLQMGASMHTAPYPPFGFVTALFQPVICYLVLFGIYSSAVSISADSKLRHSIRKWAIEESRLLGDIGSANMVQTLEKKVSEIAKTNMDTVIETSGVDPSITDDEAKEYLKVVVNEITHVHTGDREKSG